MSVYTREEVEAKIADENLEGWYFDEDGGWLRRKYSTDGWPTTLMLVNAIGYLCEAAWHHADLSVTWGKVWVKLKTHSEGDQGSRFQDRYRRREARPDPHRTDNRHEDISQAIGPVQNFLGVQDLVVGGEELLDGLLVDLHLGATDPQSSPGLNARASPCSCRLPRRPRYPGAAPH